MNNLLALALLPFGLWAIFSVFDGGDDPEPEPQPEPVDRPASAVALTGSGDGDALIGSDLNDSLMGGGGADTLDAGGGDDLLLGSQLGAGATAQDMPQEPGPYGVELDGIEARGLFDDGAGDLLDGGDGNDTLYGDSGSDTAPDTLIGGAGDDLIADGYSHGPTGVGKASFADGDAVIEAGAGNDTVLASGGDTITLGAGQDVLHLGSIHRLDADSSAYVTESNSSIARLSHVVVTDFNPDEDRLEIELAGMEISHSLMDHTVSHDYERYEVVLREENGNTIVALHPREGDGDPVDAIVLQGVTGLDASAVSLRLPPIMTEGDARGDASVTDDLLFGTVDADSLLGALADDTLSSLITKDGALADDGRADTLRGGWDDDLVIGNGGDVLDGGTGDDTLIHADRTDAAGAQGATLTDGAGRDLIYASGADTIQLTPDMGMDVVVLADPNLCSTQDLLTSHVVVRGFTPDLDDEWGDDDTAVILDLTRDMVVVDPVTGASRTITATLVPVLRESHGNTMVSLRDADTGVVYPDIVTFEGVTGITSADQLVRAPSVHLRPPPPLVGAA